MAATGSLIFFMYYLQVNLLRLCNRRVLCVLLIDIEEALLGGGGAHGPATIISSTRFVEAPVQRLETHLDLTPEQTPHL